MIKKSISIVLLALAAVANAHAVVQEPTVSVPDAGATAVFLALGALGIFAARRHFSRRS